MSVAVHSGLSVGITNRLAAVVFSCNSGGNVVVVVADDSRVSVRVVA